MPNIFGDEEPEVAESNYRANDILRRMANVVEELHSRYTDGFNKFGSDETGVVRLLLIFDEVLNNETYDGNGWAFISTAVNTVEKAAPIIQKPLAQVLERRVPSDLESARLWIVYSLGIVDCMHLSLKAMWQLGEVIDAFYKRSSPIFATKVNFKQEMLNLVQLLQHPKGSSAFTGGALEFGLDIGALSCFNTIFRTAVIANSNNNNKQGSTSSSSLVSGNSSNVNNNVSNAAPLVTTTSPTITTTTTNNNQTASLVDQLQQQQQQQYTPVTSGTHHLTSDGNTLTSTGGGKKVIRKIIKKKGGGEVVTTTVTNYQDPSDGNDNAHHVHPTSVATNQNQNNNNNTSVLPTSFNTPSANANNKQQQPQISKIQVEVQTTLTCMSRQEKAVQVNTDSNSSSSPTAVGNAGAAAGSTNNNTTSSSLTTSSVSPSKNNNEGSNNKRSFDELQELDHLLTEREEKLKLEENTVAETKRTLQTQKREFDGKKEELDEKMKSLANVAEELKRLYNELFNHSEGGSKKITTQDIDKLIPSLVTVLNGGKVQQQTQIQQPEIVVEKDSSFSNNKNNSTSSNVTVSISAEDPSNNNNSNTLPAPSPSASRAGSFSARRPMLPTSASSTNVIAGNTTNTNNNTNSNNNDSATDKTSLLTSNTSFSSRPRAQTTVNNTSNNNNNNAVSSTDFMSKKSSSTLSVSNVINNANINNGDDNEDNTQHNNNNNSNAANFTTSSTANNNNNNNNNNNARTSTATTPDGSYNASPAHSPAPRINRGFSELDSASGGGGMLVDNSSFASNATLARAALALPALAPNPNGIVTVAPDTCTTRPSQGIPYITDIFDEPERVQQLKKQNNRCPKCGTELTKNETSNPLLRSIVNMGQLALQQKPRRCHYSGEIFCQKCHTNKTALLPHKICGSWDFDEFHVADMWFDYLGANFERPIIHLPDIELVAKRPVAQQLAQFRRKLNRMHAVLVLCPAVQKQARSVFTTSYYFAREHWWSLADFVRMRLLENDAPSSLSRGLPNTELLQHLGRLMSEALDHINSCPCCRQKGYGVCTLCYTAKRASSLAGAVGGGSSLSSTPAFSNTADANSIANANACESGGSNNHNSNLQDKVAFWEDGTACPNCGAIYHASCFELRGCPKCKK